LRTDEGGANEHISDFLAEAKTIIDSIDQDKVQKIVDILDGVRSGGGRLFILGVGGGAGHASHAVNDFRKIAGIESYAPTDNVSELTARTNDEAGKPPSRPGCAPAASTPRMRCWCSRSAAATPSANISANIVSSLKLAREVGAKIVGVVGRDGGYTAKVADSCIVIPPLTGRP